jgi:hypothetical protein
LKYRSYQQFQAAFKVPFVSDLAPERWVEQFSSLKDGMREHEVEKILGAPDFARCDLNKEGDRFVGSKWQYEISVPQDFASDSQNSTIEVLFGPDGKLKDKNAVNIQVKPVPPPAEATITPVLAASPTPSAAPAASPTPSPASEATPQ